MSIITGHTFDIVGHAFDLLSDHVVWKPIFKLEDLVFNTYNSSSMNWPYGSLMAKQEIVKVLIQRNAH